MRKIKITVAILVLFVSLAKSQCISYGVTLGFDAASMKMRDVPEKITYNSMYAPILSYNINGFASYKSKSFWGISIEPGFMRKGGVQLFDYYNSIYLKVTHKVVDTYNYLQLPVLFDAYLSKRLYVSAGLEFNYRLSENAKQLDEFTWNDSEVNVSQVAEDNRYKNEISPDDNNRFNYSYLLGLQYKLTNKFDIGLRYNMGMKELMHVNWVDQYGYSIGGPSRSTIFNTYFQFLVKVKL
jgi:hypothetical protein